MPKPKTPKLYTAILHLLKSNQYYLASIAILILSVTTRFHHLNTLFHWTLDEEYWSYIPFNIATGYHVPLIGGPISGTGLNSGPLFVWLMAPFFWITNSEPIFLAAFVSTLGVITTIGLIYLVKRLYSLPLALTAALIYTTSTLITIYDRKYWNVTPIPILSLVTIYLIHLITTKSRYRHLIALSFVLSLAFHAHMTSGVLILFVLYSWLIYRLPRTRLLHLVGWFLLWQTPLILFELRHSFINTHALLRLVSGSGSLSLSSLFPSLLDSLWLLLHTTGRLLYLPALDISKELTLCTAYAPLRSTTLPLVLVFAAIVLIYSLRELKKQNLFALMLFANLTLVYLYRLIAPANSWYPGLLSEYYLIPSFLAIAVLTAKLVHQLIFTKVSPSAIQPIPKQISNLLISYRHAFIYPVALMLLTINLHTTFSLTHTHNLATKETLVQRALAETKDQPFALSVTGDPCQIYGFRYLFSVYGREPAVSYLDPIFGWLYQTRRPLASPELQLTIDADSATISVSPHEQAQNPSQDSDPQR